MNIEVRSRHIAIDDDTRAYVTRRLRFALDALGRPGLRVIVRLDDVNGPRGGEDKVCRLLVRAGGATGLVIEERDRSLRTAVDRAADRLGHRLLRSLQRSRWAREAAPLG